MATTERRDEGHLSGTTIVLGLLCAGVIVWVLNSMGGEASEPGAPDLATLSASTTKTTVAGAPRDPDPGHATDGLVVRVPKPLALRSSPDGPAFGKIGPRQFGPTWLPVIHQVDGWVQVLLPSRPNGSTGWLPSDQVEHEVSPYLIRVHLASRSLELFFEDRLTGSWPVAVGAPATPTPVGRTFVLGSITDPGQPYSPVILPLGMHSETLDTYGGGPGTVALHTWPDSSVFGTAASHGCVRVTSEALDHLTAVPLGTLVLIDRK